MNNRKFWKWMNQAPVVPDQEGNTEEVPAERILSLNGTIAEDSWFDDDVTPAMFRDELMAGDGDITVWVNSPGGDCVAAAQIYNMLSEYPGKVTVKIDGLAASAASVISMAGNEVLMSPVSMMMIHNPATIAFGDHAEMKKAIELLDAVKESIINAYVLKTGLSRNILSRMMDSESWMDANKAVELGFADGILYGKEEDPVEKPAENSAMFSRKAVNNVLMNKLEAKYGKPKQFLQEQAEIKPVEVNKVTDHKDPETGRSAEEIRERLNFIRKFI